VVLGKVVLAPARWRLSGEAVTLWRDLPETERLTAIRRWRAEWSLPRFVVLLQPESEFVVDLDDPAGVAGLLDWAKQRPEGILTLEELFPDPDTMPVSGPQGRWAHDLVIPFTRKPAGSNRPARPVRRETRRRAGTLELSRRTFLPGSECLYFKLYCGSAAADRVLAEGIGPLVERLVRSETVDRWFFLRYADPDTHLRLRLFGSPERLTAEALPQAHAMAASLLERSVLRRMIVDTYEREVERYGGPLAIALVEKAFEADSAAVIRLLAEAGEAVDSAERLRLAVLGVDRLLRDFGLPVSRRLGIVTGMIARAGDRETEGLWEREAGQRFRDERLLLENRAGSAAFRERSRALRPLAQRIRSLHTIGRIGLAPESLIGDLVHLHCNRLLRSAAQGEEAVVLRWLARLYRSKVARTRRSSG
jgi:thiopeptide-type bacteriocin biosynthesis protein